MDDSSDSITIDDDVEFLHVMVDVEKQPLVVELSDNDSEPEEIDEIDEIVQPRPPAHSPGPALASAPSSISPPSSPPTSSPPRSPQPPSPSPPPRSPSPPPAPSSPPHSSPPPPPSPSPSPSPPPAPSSPPRSPPTMSPPSSSRAMTTLKEQGNFHFRNNRYEEALRLYTQALKEAKETNSLEMAAILHFNRAMAHSKLGSNNIAIGECTEAVKLDSNYIKAHLKRAELYTLLGRYEEALVSYEYICELNKDNREYAMALQYARSKCQGIKKRDYYQILGLSHEFSQADLKRSYRLRALKHHPDRHSDADIVVRRIEEKLFKEASEAYKVLSDAKEKFKYDQTLHAESATATFDLGDLLARTSHPSHYHSKHFRKDFPSSDCHGPRDFFRHMKGGKPEAHQRGWG